MDELVQWLRAQLDEDERTARAACWDEQSAVWTARPPRAGYERYTVVDYCDDGVVVVTPENADADGVGQHVAEHDPARVLREIDAKRRILARHSPHASGSTDCAARCDQGHPGVPVCNHDGYRWPCPDVRDQADGYAARPGFREEWRP